MRRRRLAAAIPALILGGLMMFGVMGLFGCSSNKISRDYPSEPDVMLVDYYTAVTGTDGGDRSHETVLYTCSDTQARLSVFDRSEDGDETRVDYLVPLSAVDECIAVIEENNFVSWNDRTDTIAIDGSVTVVKFRRADDDYVRVSTDAMPEDGERALNQVGIVMAGYIRDEYRSD